MTLMNHCTCGHENFVQQWGKKCHTVPNFQYMRSIFRERVPSAMAIFALEVIDRLDPILVATRTEELPIILQELLETAPRPFDRSAKWPEMKFPRPKSWEDNQAKCTCTTHWKNAETYTEFIARTEMGEGAPNQVQFACPVTATCNGCKRLMPRGETACVCVDCKSFLCLKCMNRFSFFPKDVERCSGNQNPVLVEA